MTVSTEPSPMPTVWSIKRRAGRTLARLAGVESGLARIRLYRFLRPYAWALVPLILVGALQLNNHLYYDLRLGYDMPMHWSNTRRIIATGTFAPPPITPATNEAHQAPLFYILAAWVALLGNHFVDEPLMHVIPAALFVTAMLWLLLAIALVQVMLRRLHWLWRALTVSVIMLFPVNVQASVMFTNDLPVIALGMAAAVTMWLMVRAGHLLERTWWLRVAALSGLCIAFKNNGVVLMGVYILLAVALGWVYVRDHRPDRLAKVVRLALLGLPLMLIPWTINAWHTSRYLGNPIGATSVPRRLFDVVDLSFFTTFDTLIFQAPFAHGPSENSFWTLQYSTLHNDYYNHWNSSAYASWPADQMMTSTARDPMPMDHFDAALLLQFLAVPVTGLMVFAFGRSLWSVVRRPRRALRDGSIVVVLVTVVAEAAQFTRFAFYPEIQAVVIHARYLGFMYPFLFVTGLFYLWKWWLPRRSAFSTLLLLTLFANMAAYSYVALKLMWLPPLF